MGWLYMATCAFDFILAPILWAVMHATLNGEMSQWNPITLQGAGLYHVAMGAVLGVSAWSRGQEKLASWRSPPVNPSRDTDSEDADVIASRKGLMKK
jgi:hypothetical protein